MNITWKIVETDYYLSKNEKEKVIFSTEYYVLAEKNGFKKQITNKINFDLEIIEAVEAKDAVLYTDKDTLLTDKAVKVGDIKTPAVQAVEAKNPWASVDFVEYDDLTEDMVIGWVKSTLGEDEVKRIEDYITAQINAQENPPAATKGKGVPW
jgi:hypothetical protein